MKHETPDLVHKDGSLWKASYCEDNPLEGLFNRDKMFYFRELIENPVKQNPWWMFWKAKVPEYIRTGRTWEGGSFRDLFTLIKGKE